MAEITFKGEKVHTAGTLPQPGQEAPDLRLVAADFSEKRLSDYRGKKVVLDIFLSLDTSTCAKTVRKFNEAIAGRDDVVVLGISADLPTASGRFCAAEGIENVVTLSTFRDREFGDAYGVRMTDGVLAGLMSRAVVVVDEKGKVIHAQQVPEASNEPDYDSALSVL